MVFNSIETINTSAKDISGFGPGVSSFLGGAMKIEIPLSDIQKDFAEENHGLVYAFLNAHSLDEEEFYDVVIFGYLRAVRRYFTEAGLKKYKFGTIAWNCMRVDLLNYYKANRSQKRNAEVVSLHVSLSPDGPPLEHSIPSRNEMMEQLEVKLLVHDLARRVSRQQLDLVRLKSDGYGVREIARRQKTSIKHVQELLEEVRGILMDLCYE